MAIILLPPSFLSKTLTPDQRWALNFRNNLHFAACISIVATGISTVGFGFTSDHGLPEAQKNGTVKKWAHRFFAGTLFLGVSATVASVLGAAYASYVFHQIK